MTIPSSEDTRNLAREAKFKRLNLDSHQTCSSCGKLGDAGVTFGESSIVGVANDGSGIGSGTVVEVFRIGKRTGAGSGSDNNDG